MSLILTLWLCFDTAKSVDRLNIKKIGKEELPMSVKKIFIILITVVACVMIGALLLNVLMPNVMTSIVDSVENMVYNATGMSLDFNGNSKGAGTKGAATSQNVNTNDGTKGANNGKAVNGFTKGMQ